LTWRGREKKRLRGRRLVCREPIEVKIENKTVSASLTRDDYVSIRLVACGVLDCCRACGHRGHFAKECSGDCAIERWIRRCDYARRTPEHRLLLMLERKAAITEIKTIKTDNKN